MRSGRRRVTCKISSVFVPRAPSSTPNAMNIRYPKTPTARTVTYAAIEVSPREPITRRMTASSSPARPARIGSWPRMNVSLVRGVADSRCSVPRARCPARGTDVPVNAIDVIPIAAIAPKLDRRSNRWPVPSPKIESIAINIASSRPNYPRMTATVKRERSISRELASATFWKDESTWVKLVVIVTCLTEFQK